MSATKKTLLKNSFLYVVLGFLPLATNVLLAPIYSRFISPGEFGIIALASIFQGFLAIFLTLGLEAGFSRIYFDYHKKEKLIHGLMSTTLLAIVASSFFFWGILYFSGDFLFRSLLQNDGFTFSVYGNLVFFICFSTAVQTVFLTYYRNKEQVWMYSLVSLVFFFASVFGILIGVVYLKAEAMGNIAGRAIGATIFSAILLVSYFVRQGVRLKTDYLKKSLVYSLPLVPYLLLLMAYNSVDKIMVEQYFELDVLGLYNFAFLLASVISVLIYAIFNAVSPQINKQLIEEKEQSFSEVRKINILFHLLVLGVITLAIAVIVPVLKIFISEKYSSIQEYISILILVYVFQIYYVIYTVPLFFHNKTKILPWISLIILIAGVVFNLVFIPLFGIYGVCFALFFTKFSQFLAAYLFVRYYGYTKLEYLSLYKNHIVSFLIVVLFGIIFVWNHVTQTFSASVINLVPLLVFIICVPILYRNERLSFKYIYGKLKA